MTQTSEGRWHVHEHVVDLNWCDQVEIPLKLPSLGNASSSSSRMAQSSLKKKQRETVARDLGYLLKRPALPVVVFVERISKCGLDAHDNLRHSLKAVVDGIADWLGINDRDRRVFWDYGQVTGRARSEQQRRPGYQAARITIRSHR